MYRTLSSKVTSLQTYILSVLQCENNFAFPKIQWFQVVFEFALNFAFAGISTTM